jgi:hypothetical protein
MPEFLTPKQLHDRYSGKIAMQTIANWRAQAKGPDYIKAGGKVLYPLHSIVEWENARRRAK